MNQGHVDNLPELGHHCLSLKLNEGRGNKIVFKKKIAVFFLQQKDSTPEWFKLWMPCRHVSLVVQDDDSHDIRAIWNRSPSQWTLTHMNNKKL